MLIRKKIPLWLSAVYILAGELLGCCVLGELPATGLLKHKELFADRKAAGRGSPNEGRR